MLEIKVMPLAQFMQTASDSDEAELKMMYSHIRSNTKREALRLDYGNMPLYACGNRIFGGGDCHSILSHRRGYGYTIIDVGDRGYWTCAVQSKSKDNDGIAFYDGETEEVYERLMQHF